MNIFLSSLFLFILALPANAKPLKQFLVCLGQEEAYMHKHKVGGAYAKLNQEMISAFVQLSDHIIMRPKLEKQVCAQKFPSIEILKLLITEKRPPLISKTNKMNVQLHTVDKNSIKELQQKAIYIFVDFINAIQTQMKSPRCLEKQIPQLKDFFKKMRYTLEDVGPEELVREIKDIDSVFKKLQQLNFKKKC